MSWFKKLKSGLKSSSDKISDGITGIFTKKKLDDATLAELEDLLITADLGVDTALEITESLRAEKFDKEVSEEEVKSFLAEKIAKILAPVATNLNIDNTEKPYVIMFVGVNGNGKTTSIGKLAKNFRDDGKKVMLAAADTFRAAAVEQLQVWGKRADVPVFTGNPNQEPASVAFQAIEKAQNDGIDLLIIDTAGRLQNKHNLMAELAKIKNVCAKKMENTPHQTILVLDATTGQNAISQVEHFMEVAEISGLIITKLDGTAKGGIVVALAKKFDIPLYAIGVGEGIEDLKPFDANDFAKNLVGL